MVTALLSILLRNWRIFPEIVKHEVLESQTPKKAHLYFKLHLLNLPMTFVLRWLR